MKCIVFLLLPIPYAYICHQDRARLTNVQI